MRSSFAVVAIGAAFAGLVACESQAVEQLDGVAPPPPPTTTPPRSTPPPPPAAFSFGTVEVRHSASQIELSAQAVKTSICCGVVQTLRAEADSVIVVCDRQRVLQVLSNLIGNAMKFTRRGDTIVVRGMAARRGAEVSVEDHGPGIESVQLRHVFERFWQAAGKPTGTGLGLYIAKAIVDAHAGRIWVESAVGEGSTFTFTLPTGPQSRRERLVQAPAVESA